MIDLERAVMALDKPQVDLAPLHNRLAALQASLAGVQAEVRNRHALDTVERRLASLQEAVQGIPEADLTPVIGAVHSIDARLDLGALENRLTAIEYGLAAIHHSLRSRPEQVVTRTDATWQARPAPNGPLAKPRMPAPPRPPRDADPINAVRRLDDQANLLTDPAFGPPDDLEQVHGVGPMLRELLNDIGVYYYWQIAEWTPDEIAFVDSRLMHFRGRIRRDDWVDHARTLAAAPTSARRPAGWDVRS
jgi:predicted flap endonuclease-1-like 5' DNA nuclease